MLAALYGAAEAFFRPAAGGLVPRLVPEEQLLQANSLIAMSQSLGMVLGPALAGVLIALFGPGSAIAIDAASFVVSAGCLWLMSRGPARAWTPGETGAAFLAQLREGWGEVTSRAWLRSFLGVLAAYHLIALPCVLALGPVVADRELDGASSWAVIVAMFGIGSIIGAAIGLRASPQRPMLACAIAFLGAACQPAIIAGAGQHAGDRGVRAAGGHLRRVRLHGVGDDARPRGAGGVALARDLVRLVHLGRADAARLRARRAGRGRRSGSTPRCSRPARS